jgi:Cu(I)/Ag(I) efflux system membrane protein CusA/SilA
MIRDEDGLLTGYVYMDLSTKDYGGFVAKANQLLNEKLHLPTGYTYTWSGEYEFEVRAKQRLKLIVPVVFFVIFLLLYLIFNSVTEAAVLIYLHESLDKRIASGISLKHDDIEAAAIEGAVMRLRPKLMTVTAVLASLIPILWESGIGSDVMKPIAAPIVGGMITSTIHVLILVPVFFTVMKERALRRGTLQSREP